MQLSAKPCTCTVKKTRHHHAPPCGDGLSHLDLYGLRRGSANEDLAARELADPGQVHRAYFWYGRLLDDGAGRLGGILAGRWGRVVGRVAVLAAPDAPVLRQVQLCCTGCIIIRQGIFAHLAGLQK